MVGDKGLESSECCLDDRDELPRSEVLDEAARADTRLDPDWDIEPPCLEDAREESAKLDDWDGGRCEFEEVDFERDAFRGDGMLGRDGKCLL